MLAFAGFAWTATGFWSALGFRALMGIGWAGSYMPGLKALSDLTEGPGQSRAVAAHAAAVGVSAALSFGVAGAVNAWLGWRWALVPGALGAVLAFLFVLIGLPARAPRPSAGPRPALLDFRPVLRNRSALAASGTGDAAIWNPSVGDRVAAAAYLRRAVPLAELAVDRDPGNVDARLMLGVVLASLAANVEPPDEAACGSFFSVTPAENRRGATSAASARLLRSGFALATCWMW